MDSDYWPKVAAAILSAGAMAAFPGGVAEVHVQSDGSYQVVPATFDEYYIIDETVKIECAAPSFEITILNQDSAQTATKLIFGPITYAGTLHSEV